MARPKILYADEEQQNLAMLQKGAGDRFDLLTASTAEQALALIDHHDVAVVVANQTMPDMAGSELLGEASRRRPDAVTMFVTAFPSFENAVDAINQGRVVRYIRKPWNPEEMRQALDDGVSLFEQRRENRVLRERLIQDERNVIIGKLASGLVHELANIAAVLSIVESVREDWGSGIDLSEELSTLKSGLDKYWALVDSLKFCGLGEEIELKRAKGDVRDVLRDAFSFASNITAIRLLTKFELEPCDQELAAEIDSTALFHSVLNLLKNAAEAAPAGRGEVRLTSARADDLIRIDVRDNGPGIPPALATKILDGFHSTKGASGTGLGLLVTRRIVEGHGGRLEFENLEGGGCAFSILLPAA
jgi:signal transduction histidine kinase